MTVEEVDGCRWLVVDDLRDHVVDCLCLHNVRADKWSVTAAGMRSGLLTVDAVLPGTVCRGLKQIHAKSSILVPI